MTLQFWFWIFYVLGLLGWTWGYWPIAPSLRPWGAGLFFFILIGILGYATFGGPLKH